MPFAATINLILRHRRLIWFSTIMFFVFFADGIMSYASPVFIEEKMNSAWLMGIIISSSSIFGLVADMIISKQFAQKEYRFFARWLLALALFFPLSLLFMPAQPLTFLIAMAVWGIYFEFISFSQFNFVHRVVGAKQHTAAWGLMDTFKAVAGIAAPIAATFLLEISMDITLYVVVGSLIVAMVLFYFYRKSNPEHESTIDRSASGENHEKRSFWQEIKLWRVLFKKIWPMYLFFFAFIMLEAAFWTVGPLLSEEIKDTHQWSSFLLSAYVLPSLFTPPLAHMLSVRFSKKKVAFTSALIGSILLATGTFFLGHSAFLIIFVFLSSVFFSIDHPEIEAVFEDYLSRIDDYSNDLIGLQSTATSLSYIVGPILAGGLASLVGSSTTLGIFALFLAAVSLILLVVTPRKIKMPHQELAQVAAPQP